MNALIQSNSQYPKHLKTPVFNLHLSTLTWWLLRFRFKSNLDLLTNTNVKATVLNCCNKKALKCILIYLAAFGSWLHHSGSFMEVHELSSCGVWAKLFLCVWDLSSPTRDQAPACSRQILNHWTTKEVPKRNFKWPWKRLAPDLCSPH